MVGGSLCLRPAWSMYESFRQQSQTVRLYLQKRKSNFPWYREIRYTRLFLTGNRIGLQTSVFKVRKGCPSMCTRTQCQQCGSKKLSANYSFNSWLRSVLTNSSRTHQQALSHQNLLAKVDKVEHACSPGPWELQREDSESAYTGPTSICCWYPTSEGRKPKNCQKANSKIKNFIHDKEFQVKPQRG